MSDSTLIYLMGAGRSGTTILATLLGNIDGVRNLGELHQLPEHVLGEKNCSCGKELYMCPFWSENASELELFKFSEYGKAASDLENHSKILGYFFKNKKNEIYSRANQELLDKVLNNDQFVVDSAKYIGRALALKYNTDFNIKYIYVVRDPRGVIDSFSKNVQTKKSFFSSIFYYAAVNFLASLVSNTLLKGKVLKVRYEDVIGSPEDTLRTISAFIGAPVDDLISKLNAGDELDMGHIIGGNRIRDSGKVKFNPKDKWRDKMSTLRSFSAYLILLPFCMINRYKL